MNHKIEIHDAAHKVLSNCLSLSPGAKFLIFIDETSLEVSRTLFEVGLELDLEPLVLYYPCQIQNIVQDRPLPIQLIGLLQEAQAAFICLNGSPESFMFRDGLRRNARNAGCKVAHMPGINIRILQMANVDYEAMNELCELFALALVKSNQVEILTHDHQGNLHTLRIPLAPWKRYPIISDARIEAGSWGYVPAGETYIAPPEKLAEGSIVIDGSIPNYRFCHGEKLILFFKAGYLENWQLRTSPAAQHLEKYFIDFARRQGDKNWSNLAEIGLGTNPLVRRLSGFPRVDEKKYGSVHLALGDNKDMGGRVRSAIHCDMVCTNAEVRIDSKSIIKNKRVAIEEKDWRENYQALVPPPRWNKNLSIRCTAVNAGEGADGGLIRFWPTSNGRVCSVHIGDKNTSPLALSLYQMLQKNRQGQEIANLSHQFRSFKMGDLLKLSYLLMLYGLVMPISNYPQE